MAAWCVSRMLCWPCTATKQKTTVLKCGEIDRLVYGWWSAVNRWRLPTNGCSALSVRPTRSTAFAQCGTCFLDGIQKEGPCAMMLV